MLITSLLSLHYIIIHFALTQKIYGFLSVYLKHSLTGTVNCRHAKC